MTHGKIIVGYFFIPEMKKYKYVKNILDRLVSIFILLASLPLIFINIVLLSIILRSSPFLFQRRGITKNNKIFKIIKFRTIRINQYQESKDRNILYKPSLEEYIPSYCRWLRKTGLDELPQLINVIKGEMSLVGPRPLMMPDLDLLEENNPDYYSLRNGIKVKPGITGLWQVSGRREEGVGNLVNLDVEYDENISFKMDMEILFKTIPLVIRGKHSDAIINGMVEYSHRAKFDFNPV